MDSLKYYKKFLNFWKYTQINSNNKKIYGTIKKREELAFYFQKLKKIKNTKFKNNKIFWRATENVRSEVYIIKMGIMKI